MAGLRELSALATSVHEPSNVKASELAAHPVDKSRPGYPKRRRLQQFCAPCADSLESLHLTWEVSSVMMLLASALALCCLLGMVLLGVRYQLRCCLVTVSQMSRPNLGECDFGKFLLI